MTPDRYDTRVRPKLVGDAIGKPRTVWIVERFESCDCPECEADGHWRDGMTGWLDSPEQAAPFARHHGRYRPEFNVLADAAT